MRSCVRTGCRWPAAATLGYRYVTAEVWLSDLAEPHPATHDLCPHHADDLRVPKGWTLVDDRQPAAAYHEPSAAEIAERVTSFRGQVDRILQQPEDETPRRSRYAELLENLPTFDPPDEAGEPVANADRRQAVTVDVGVSHEIAPIVREQVPGRPDRSEPRQAAILSLPSRGTHGTGPKRA